MVISSEKKQELLRNLDEFFAKTDKANSSDAENLLTNFTMLKRDVLDRLVVVKLNGGLGTTMGCYGPKSFIKVKGELSFLDIARQQHKVFNETHHCDVPLILMNSFYTDELTIRELGKNSNVRTFCQSRCPRIDSETLLPVEETDEKQKWYPPGHGDIFHSLAVSGLLDELLQQGRDIMFVSNIDNTGATLDLKIAQFACDEAVDYIMECTTKTQSDIKGGTLIDIAGQLMHLEFLKYLQNIWMNSVPHVHSNPQQSSYYSVRNLYWWMHTKFSVVLLNGVHVKRSRFLPVKKTDDLLAISSDLYFIGPDRSLKLIEERDSAPIIQLGKYFQTVDEFHARFDDYPNICDLRSLKIEGDVRFEKNVTLKGDVNIVNNSGKQQIISSGTLINNERVVFN
ncbi:UTP--glucose-1-phosphate uridylyltransferase [Dictyocaulus viviparus]|uniref:UTP--glucose-1-phosphate uridylyltransferase n=1 Tax=Dictyocaulus viviparus TaxID=29172 RepID=A0A0D8XRC4_DICVI|nr:UTP--glucose-1-phosphate uridylyltransferase [Dictyocaulus viviparus]